MKTILSRIISFEKGLSPYLILVQLALIIYPILAFINLIKFFLTLPNVKISGAYPVILILYATLYLLFNLFVFFYLMFLNFQFYLSAHSFIKHTLGFLYLALIICILNTCFAYLFLDIFSFLDPQIYKPILFLALPCLTFIPYFTFSKNAKERFVER